MKFLAAIAATSALTFIDNDSNVQIESAWPGQPYDGGNRFPADIVTGATHSSAVSDRAATTWHSGMNSSAGLTQSSACAKSVADGVVCDPSFVQFATGMNGDEDLGHDISMKGEPFHFRQQAFAQDAHTDQFDQTIKYNTLDVATVPANLPLCTGTNGPVGTNCQRKVCTGTNGPMDGPASSGCIREEPDDIWHYNEDPVAGRPFQTTGDQTHTEQVPGFAPYGNPNDATQFGNQNNEQAFDVTTA